VTSDGDFRGLVEEFRVRLSNVKATESIGGGDYGRYTDQYKSEGRNRVVRCELDMWKGDWRWSRSSLLPTFMEVMARPLIGSGLSLLISLPYKIGHYDR
jgi:hypothetical protein